MSNKKNKIVIKGWTSSELDNFKDLFYWDYFLVPVLRYNGIINKNRVHLDDEHIQITIEKIKRKKRK